MGKAHAAQPENAITFRRLIHHLADHIGRHYIPVRTRAEDIGGFLGPDSVHHELIRSLVRAIYKSNCCGHLDAPVFATQTFNALGNIRGRLQQSPRADVDQINLIEDIGRVVRDLLSRHSDDHTHAAHARRDTNVSAQIVPLRRARF